MPTQGINKGIREIKKQIFSKAHLHEASPWIILINDVPEGPRTKTIRNFSNLHPCNFRCDAGPIRGILINLIIMHARNLEQPNAQT